MFVVLFLVSSLSLALGSDAPCTGAGGHCQDDSLSCSGHYQSNMCSGSSSRRCCIAAASGHDSQCTGQGGVCEDDSNSCSGHFQSGLCSGGTHRRCCLPASASGSCPHIVSRSEWGARPPKHSIGDMSGPAQYVFIHHGSSGSCHDKASCERILRSYQDYHMDGHGWTDIGYNFVVGEDGNAYMARGWTEIGAHTQGYNSVGVAICVIGDFNNRVPNDAALNKIKQLIQCGLNNGYISQSYTLKGHRDVGNTDCPGDQLYNLIHSWPHYASGTQRYGR